MKLIKQSESAYFKFDVDGKKNLTDKFDLNGRISSISLKVESSEVGNSMKIKIGETILTDKELIDENCPYHPSGEILFHSSYMENAIGKTFIEFKKGDVFEFEQPLENVSELCLWISEIETKD